MKNKISFIVKTLAFIISIALVMTFSAALVTASAQELYVYDYADLLTDEEEASLSTLAMNQSSQYGVSITFLTYDDDEGKSTRDYTDDFYDQTVAEPNGFLLAIDMDNREVYVNTVGTCIDNISDEEIDLILDSTYTYASDGDYADFFSKSMALVLDAYVGDIAENGGDEYYAEPANPWLPTSYSLIATVVVMVIVAVVLILVHNKNNRAPSAEAYMGSSFAVENSNTMFMGIRHEVMHDYYADNDNNGGGSSHISSGGVSHGGGGRGF